MCPVPGCRSKPQVRLALHFNQKHKNIKRQQLLNDSLRLGLAQGGNKPKIPRQRDQPTLHQLVAKSSPQQARRETQAESRIDGGTDLLDAGTDPLDAGTDPLDAGTRNFPRFELDDPSLTQFTCYLQGIDGGEKPLKSAHEATVDVSKFFRLVGVTMINWLIFIYWLDFYLNTTQVCMRNISHCPLLGPIDGQGSADRLC